MVRFLDGPASGLAFLLKRAPRYLRAVRRPDGEWDALDRLEDAPEPYETIAVYQRHGEAGALHIQATAKHGGGWWAVANYRAVHPAPPDFDIRGTPAWRAWCQRAASAAQEDPTS